MITKIMSSILSVMGQVFSPAIPVLSPFLVRVILVLLLGFFIIKMLDPKKKTGICEEASTIELFMQPLPLISLFLMGVYVAGAGQFDHLTAFEPIVRPGAAQDMITFYNYADWSDNPRYTSLLAMISVPVTTLLYFFIGKARCFRFLLTEVFAFFLGTVYIDFEIGVGLFAAYGGTYLLLLYWLPQTIWKLIDGLLSSLFLFVSALAWILPKGAFLTAISFMGHVSEIATSSSNSTVEVDTAIDKKIIPVPNYAIDKNGKHCRVTSYGTYIGIECTEGEISVALSDINGRSYVEKNGKRFTLVY